MAAGTWLLKATPRAQPRGSCPQVLLIPSHLEAGARLAFKVDSGPSSEKEKVDV